MSPSESEPRRYPRLARHSQGECSRWTVLKKLHRWALSKSGRPTRRIKCTTRDPLTTLVSSQSWFDSKQTQPSGVYTRLSSSHARTKSFCGAPGAIVYQHSGLTSDCVNRMRRPGESLRTSVNGPHLQLGDLSTGDYGESLRTL